jgi:hypothetical protein
VQPIADETPSIADAIRDNAADLEKASNDAAGLSST